MNDDRDSNRESDIDSQIALAWSTYFDCVKDGDPGESMEQYHYIE